MLIVKTPISDKEKFFIEKRNEYFVELRQQREELESEMEKRRREIEEASLRARREYEVTIKNLDYQRVILHNQKYYDLGEF